MHFCHEELAAIFAAITAGTYAWNWFRYWIQDNMRVVYLAPVLLASLFLTGCVSERIIYVPIDSDAAVVADAGNAGMGEDSAVVNDAASTGEDVTVVGVDAYYAYDTRMDFPPCPGLTEESTLYRAETNTCLGTLVNFVSIQWYQGDPSTCTWDGMLAVEWCTSTMPVQVFPLTGDWEPVGPGQRGVRVSFTCGVHYDCLITMMTDTPNQADMTCTSGRESCSLHLVH